MVDISACFALLYFLIIEAIILIISNNVILGKRRIR